MRDNERVFLLKEEGAIGRLTTMTYSRGTYFAVKPGSTWLTAAGGSIAGSFSGQATEEITL